MSALNDQLIDAEKAYHDLLTGKAVRVVVDQNGERVEFTAANAQRLYQYIQILRGNLYPGVTPSNGPAGFIF